MVLNFFFYVHFICENILQKKQNVTLEKTEGCVIKNAIRAPKKTKTPMRAGRPFVAPPIVAPPVEIVAAQPNKIDQAFKNLLVSKLANPSENISKVLQVVCKDPDNCLAIGHYGFMIKSLFEDFRKLSLINVDNIKSLGKPSTNGFVLECPFYKNNYTAYTVLKSSASPTADNLFYEYYVGTTFINKLLTRFPVFVETYDCYKYKSPLKLQITKQIAVKTNLIQSITRDRFVSNDFPRYTWRFIRCRRN